MVFIYILGGLLASYLFFTLLMTYVVHQLPRKPYKDRPDWGETVDTRIAAVDGGSLEVWRVEPELPSKGIVLLVHGWGRNRDRMVERGRYFGRWGYTVVIHSARDHGRSSPHRWMSALKFAEDIDSVLNWIGRPVILYGHSAGAVAAIIAAARHPRKIKLLFLEGCYADNRKALLSFYRWCNPLFGLVFGPMILCWLILLYRGELDRTSPAALAPKIRLPVMVVHGEKDRRFPIDYALELKNCFSGTNSEIFIAKGAEHSESCQNPGYAEALKRFLERHGPASAEGQTN